MACWNVENLFDTRHDTLKDDCAFTPVGDNHWTSKRYQDKQNKIFKTIAAMQWPVVVGMAEVENDHVLRDLCSNTPLRKLGYDFVHFESPDQRGVDCALLYRKGLFDLFESMKVTIPSSHLWAAASTCDASFAQTRVCVPSLLSAQSPQS